MSYGKTFERELIAAYRGAGAIPYRNTDGLTGKGKSSVKSLPDMFVFWDTGIAELIEAKVVKGKSMPFNRLADHQRDELERFDTFAPNFEGAVAVSYYNGLRGKERMKRAFHIPISQWLYAEETCGRKSLTMEHAARIGTELLWQPGYGWHPPTPGDNT